jgi:hypothetical protein
MKQQNFTPNFSAFNYNWKARDMQHHAFRHEEFLRSKSSYCDELSRR